MQPTDNKRNITILFFTMIVVMLGFGMIIPILPFYIEQFGASGKGLGALMATFSIMQFIFSPIWGALSDRYGRKPILMIGVLGNVLAQVLMGLSTQLWMLFVARALAGILSSATLPTAMAYISDSTSHDQRSGGMGIIGAAQGIGMVLGPGIGGWLAAQSLQLPFFVAAGFSALILVLIAAFFPESLPQSARRHGQKVQGVNLGELWQGLLGPIGILLFLAFLLNFALANFEGIFGLYAQQRFNYGPREVGLVLMAIGIVSAIVQGALTGPFTRRWGDVRILKAALIASAIGFVIMLEAADMATLLLTVMFFVTSNAMLRPGVSSLISKRTPGGQGSAMGLNNAFMSLGRIVGPLWAGFAFDLNLNFPYLTGGLIMLLGFIASVFWLRETHHVAPGAPLPAPSSK